MSNPIANLLDVLQSYYADKDGNPYPINDVQLTVYLDALALCDTNDLQDAARKWMRSSRWFPKVSDLLDLVCPEPDFEQCALIAWSAVEGAVKQFGSRDACDFEDYDVAETVRRTFRTWEGATWMEHGSPQWAIKRQSFLAIYKSIASGDGRLRQCGRVGPEKAFYPGYVNFIDGLPPEDWRQIRHGSRKRLDRGEDRHALGE